MRKRKHNRGDLGKDLKKGLTDYCSETSAHGFRYVVEGRNILEKSFWILIMTIGFFYCGYQIYEAFSYWEEHPLMTTIDAVDLPVHELDFPAITVCDTESLKMPRRNRWMFLEQFLNGLELIDPEQEARNMFPGRNSIE